MRSYLELAKLHSRHNRRQSYMTIACIFLAVFLVTSVFSMVDFEYMHMSENMIRSHGNWHILLKNISANEMNEVLKEADIEESCCYDTLNYNLDEDYLLDGHMLCIVGTEPAFMEMVPGSLLEGHFPEDDSEVLLSLNAKDVFGYSIGDKVVFDTPDGEHTYTICGFIIDTSISLSQDAILSILNYETFDKITVNGIDNEPVYYIRFKKSFHIKDDIARLKKAYGLTDENISENTAILGLMGISTNSYIVGLYGIAGILVVLVILAGIFMISGSMNANISERTQYFGMLRCIGTSKSQVRHIVRREALKWLKLAIPTGICASMLACWGICAVLAYGIGGEWENMPVGKISFTGIALGIMVGIITVLISAEAPARKASKVSPIKAVAGEQTVVFNNSAKIVTDVETSLGVYHAVKKKKNLLLISGSFALSIILFLMCSVMIDWINTSLTTTKSYTPQVSIYRRDYGAVFNQEFAQKIREITGVKNVYGRMHVLADVETNTGIKHIDLISYDDLQLEWAKEDLIRGGNIESVKNEIGSVIVVYDQNHSINIGDCYKLNGNELHVAAVISDNPFSTTDSLTVICSEETFTEYVGETEYSVIDIQLEKDAGDDTINNIRAMIDDDLVLSDRRAINLEANSTYYAFSLLVYTFLGILGLIAALNIINSITMSVSSRSRQYGMMRAIGLENHQLKKMILAEAMTLAVVGCFAGCVPGTLLHAWFYKTAISSYYGTEWQFPAIELCIIVALVFGSAMAAVYFPLKRFEKKTITELIG